jgi:soluble lytic murein transglycosylase-like protein
VACKLDLRDSVISEANNQGVPPEIALAVATQESRLCHWAPNGAVLRGAAGEYGVMQLMPATAAAMGVDPTDVYGNIHGGVKYLRQLYDRHGDWSLAVQHYNGSGPAARSYASAVMAIANRFGLALNMSAPSSPPDLTAGVMASASAQVQTAGVNPPAISKNLLIGIGVVAGAGLLGFALAG